MDRLSWTKRSLGGGSRRWIPSVLRARPLEPRYLLYQRKEWNNAVVRQATVCPMTVASVQKETCILQFAQLLGHIRLWLAEESR